MGSYLTAFLVGGLVCALSQIFLDNTNYTPAHLLVGLVVLGSIFTGLGWYEPIIKFAGAGITIPVSNFGYVLTKGVLDAIVKDGLFGLFKGVLETASSGVSASVIIAFFIALVFNPKN
ncbi:MAG: stage V sporulation protein AE [Halothermotrichaceae bacterium]